MKHLEDSHHVLPFLCDKSPTAGALAEKYETALTKETAGGKQSRTAQIFSENVLRGFNAAKTGG